MTSCERQMFVLGSFTMLLFYAGLAGLWDLVRHQVELRTGFYDLPFGYTVPWWWAGDLFITMAILGMMLTWYLMLKEVDKP